MGDASQDKLFVTQELLKASLLRSERKQARLQRQITDAYHDLDHYSAALEESRFERHQDRIFSSASDKQKTRLLKTELDDVKAALKHERQHHQHNERKFQQRCSMDLGTSPLVSRFGVASVAHKIHI